MWEGVAGDASPLRSRAGGVAAGSLGATIVGNLAAVGSDPRAADLWRLMQEKERQILSILSALHEMVGDGNEAAV